MLIGFASRMLACLSKTSLSRAVGHEADCVDSSPVARNRKRGKACEVSVSQKLTREK